MKANKNWVGKKVRALDEYDSYAPYVGAIGTVIEYDDSILGEDLPYRVRWEETDSTDNYNTWASPESIELVEKDEGDINMSYDEIWKMLEPKMEKNGFKTKMSYCKANPTVTNSFEMKMVKTYDEEEVHKAVALAYKIGYMRAMKGRPFKYANTTKIEVRVENLEDDSNKCPNAPCCAKSVVKKRVVRKKTGHWEKVDPKNLPEEGAKVRYARPDGEEHFKPICVGKEGQFWRSKVVFSLGLRDTKGDWYDFDNHLDCLDIWVEGEGDAE